MNTAEVIERSRCFLKEYGYIPDMVSEARFNRRPHRIPDALRRSFTEMNDRAADNPLKTYLIDGFPVPVRRNIRIKN